MFLLDYWCGCDGRMNAWALRLHRHRTELHPSLIIHFGVFVQRSALGYAQTTVVYN